PNFEGAETAARTLSRLREFQSAEVVKVNPDSPQKHVREAALRQGRRLIVPTPRLAKGFLLLEPNMIPRNSIGKASTIRGAFTYGRKIALEELPEVDLVVAGSVAVTPEGARVGKGGGYSEMEYGILRELKLAGEGTPIATTVHDVQVVDEIPVEEHDFLVDLVVTPTRTIRTNRTRSQPKGIIWEEITPRMLEEMPVLKELKKRRNP
ncbi:MAG: 5-formyltetrahydrofolate cyclo-ligase, partial [Candidatus Brockarchaeota archaeon]|nr:5-formyltetrahydrofolate cyclo-ligase [Candidatus Brockarchaeota archaeon]